MDGAPQALPDRSPGVSVKASVPRGPRKGSTRQRSEGFRVALAPRRQAKQSRCHEQTRTGLGDETRDTKTIKFARDVREIR